MNGKIAKANVEPVRQRTQYSCMASSMAMCLRALDKDVTEDEVNRVMGARPMQGAAWEQALATAQHYGCRATLTMPSTVEQLKAWTDAGVPVMIAWNPEGRPWSHASVVFDVDDDLNVYVADPNIPNPKQTVRVVPEDEFYGKWYEKFPDYLVRRPACAISIEVTVEGEQVAPFVARTAGMGSGWRTGRGRMASAVPDDAEKVPGTNFWVSKTPSRSPFRGQKDQFKIYNQHGGVVGGAPRREDAVAKAKKMASAKVAYGVSVKRLRSGEVVINAGPSYQRSAKMLLERAGWDWRLVKDVAGSWIFPRGTKVDDLMRDLAEVDPVLKTSAMRRTAEPYDCYKDGLRGRELADCYKRFPLDLSSKEIRFIQRYYPNWSPRDSYSVGRRRNQQQIRVMPERTKEDIGKVLVAFAIHRINNDRSRKFLAEVYNKGQALTGPQQEWVDDLVSKYQHLIRAMPSGMALSPSIYDNYTSVIMGRSSPMARKWLMQHAGLVMDGQNLDRVRIDGTVDEQNKEEVDWEAVKSLNRLDKDHWKITYWEPPSQGGDTFATYKVPPLQAYLFWFRRGGDNDIYDYRVHVQEIQGEKNLFRSEVTTDLDTAMTYAQACLAAYMKGEDPARVAKPARKSLPRVVEPESDEDQAPARRRPPKPSAPKTVVDSAVVEKLRILDTLAAQVKNWPEGKTHVEKVKADYQAGRNPSPDDLKKLRNILYRNRMRGEADHFRTASGTGNLVMAKSKKKPQSMKDKMKVDKTPVGPPRNEAMRGLIERGNAGAGKHHTRDRDVEKGRSRKPKHKKDWDKEGTRSPEEILVDRQAGSFWQPLSQGGGWKYVDDQILAYLLWESGYTTVKDPNVPAYSDVIDDEELADGIPDLMRSHAQSVRAWEQWQRQGWWPRPVKNPQASLHLTVTFRPKKMTFEARFDGSQLRKAMADGEKAIETIRASKYPRWMKPMRAAALKRQARYQDWHLNYPHLSEKDQNLIAWLQQTCEREGVEAADAPTGLKMMTWDLGYQGGRLSRDFERLGKILKVNVRAEYKNGMETNGKSASYSGNPDGNPIYPVQVDHGENQALSGGHDIMKRLVDRYLVEQGRSPRETNPRLAAETPTMELRGRRVKVNGVFVQKLKQMYRAYILENSPMGGFTLVHPASDNDPRFNGGSQYDFYFQPSRDRGWWDVAYTPGFLLLLQKDGEKMRAETVRMARTTRQLTRGERVLINQALVRAKLDGNGRFRKPEHAYNAALGVLSHFGIELDEVVSSHLFKQRPSGVLKIDIAYTNKEDSFSPVPISNSVLYIQYTELREDLFEAVAYLS